MYSLVRRYIKTAIAFLFVGLALGGWMLVRRELLHSGAMPYAVGAHTHAIFVGFVMMMILGVALWLFPRPDRFDTRYSPALAETAYWLLVTGTTARIAGELARPGSDALWLRVAIVIAGLFQIAGLAVYFFTMWSRIRALGSKARESRGERF
jgi:heme/copper-type cytochrome/quinol oxidase subunit 1